MASLLQSVLVAELLSPPTKLWVVSPWISDVVVIDNTANVFTGLAADLPAEAVRLSTFLASLYALGTSVAVVTRPADGVNDFGVRLSDATAGAVQVLVRDELHTKGLLGGSFFLNGSMNLTYRGIEVNEEYVRLTLDSGTIAEARVNFEHAYGTP